MKSLVPGVTANGSRSKGRGETGASLVEFALIAPFLILLLLGVIEFGYLFGEFNDVRHGAREGARAAAVNAGNNAFLHDVTCHAMDLTTNVTVRFTDGSPGSLGDTAAVQVVASPQSLSGLALIEVFLPSTLESTVEFRLEQDSDDWFNDAGPIPC
ncbi:MAG TPA: TadE family protein [Acidimicrobiia bacterium]|jgi:Flp pilus assembly protein TadG